MMMMIMMKSELRLTVGQVVVDDDDDDDDDDGDDGDDDDDDDKNPVGVCPACSRRSVTVISVQFHEILL